MCQVFVSLKINKFNYGGMTLLRIAVCDDEKKEHELLKGYLPRLMKSTAYSFEIQYFTCGEELLHYYNQQSSYPFHILLMDIELRGLNGIEVAKKSVHFRIERFKLFF